MHTIALVWRSYVRGALPRADQRAALSECAQQLSTATGCRLDTQVSKQAQAQVREQNPTNN